MDRIVEQAIISAGQHLGAVILALYEGVAFRKDGKTYEIFSHEGDELGEITTADLNFAINIVKRQGRAVGKCKSYKFDEVSRRFDYTQYEPAFTFAWVGWHSAGV